MKKYRGIFFKFLSVMFTFFVSLFSVFAADGDNATSEQLQGAEMFLSFTVLLLLIIAPVLKKREKTTFISSKNKVFTI